MCPDKPEPEGKREPVTQVSIMLDQAFKQVDDTTGAALDELKRQAENNRPSSRPSTRPAPDSIRVPKNGKPHSFFLLVRDCLAPGALSSVMIQVGRVAKVVDSGVGTAADAAAGWLEVMARVSGVMALRAKLGEEGLNERIHEILEIVPGQGKLQARQLALPHK